jgi:hypothetical protein
MTDPEPPDDINYGLGESLELLAALEDASDDLGNGDHLTVVAELRHEIASLSRKVGRDRQSGGRDGRRSPESVPSSSPC